MRAKNQPSRRRRSRASLKRDYVRDNDGQFARVPGSGRGGKRSAAELAKELDDMLAKFDALAADLNDDDDDDYDISEIREKLTSLRDRKREKENRREVDFDTGNYGEVNMAILGNGEISIVFSASAADVDMSPETAKELVNGLDDLRKKLPPGVNAGSPRSEVIGRFESSDGTIAAEMWDDGLVEIGDPDEVGNEDTEEELFTLDLDEVPDFTDLLEELADKAGNGTKGSRRSNGLKRNYVRDGDGQFAVTPGGGVSNELDKLNLASRLPAGYTVRSSARPKASSSGQAALVAELDTPAGPRTHVGIIDSNQAKKWDAGTDEDPERQAQYNDIRDRMDALEARGQGDSEEYEDLSNELASFWEEGERNRTASLTPEQKQEFVRQFDAGFAKAQAHALEYDLRADRADELEDRHDELMAEHADQEIADHIEQLTRERGRLQTRRNQLSGEFLATGSDRDRQRFEEAEAALRNADAEIERQRQIMREAMPGPVVAELDQIAAEQEGITFAGADRDIASGEVGDLRFEIVGSDEQEDDWVRARVMVRPPGGGDDWFEDAYSDDEYALFKGLRQVGGFLDSLKGEQGAKSRNGSRAKAGSRTMQHQTKTMAAQRFQVKSALKGEFTAVLATLNQIDSDGDVTLPGAFDGSEFPISAYGHKSWEGALPVGTGRIKEVGNEAILEGKFFMDVPHARDTFLVVKNLGPLGQWSYGYDAEDFEHGYHNGKAARFLKKQKVHEASPVLVGAGVNTRTLSTKNRNSSFSGEAAAVVTAVKALTDRAADVMAMRRQRGKGLGADSVRLLTQVTGELKRLQDILDAPASDADVLNAIWLSQVERAHR